MLARQLLVLPLALVLGASAAQGQQITQYSTGGSVSLTPSVATLVDKHDALAAQFRRLAEAAIAPTAKPADRAALVGFVRTKVTPRLSQEMQVLFPTFDSVIGGGYAVPATLFDLDAVSYLVNELERTTENGAAFETRTFALGLALDGYFTKVQLLVLPVLKERLGPAALGSTLSQLDRR